MKINPYIGRLVLIFWVFGANVLAQSNDPTDAPKTDGALEQATQENSLLIVEPQNNQIKEAPYNALAPAKAAFFSAVLPGLGQAYNKKYWKIPIVYGGIATGVYFYQRNTEDYNRFRDAYKRRLAGYQDDEFQGVSDARLRDAQKTAGRNRDVSLAMAIGVYLLNILDANVDAHLLRYNLNEDLTLRPEFLLQSDHRPNVYGVSLNISLP